MLRRCKRKGSGTVGNQSKMQRSAISLLKSPVTSGSDKKQYRLIKLSNGLKALLVHHDFESSESGEEVEKPVSESEKSITDGSENSDEDGEEEEDEEEEHEREKLAAVALCVGVGSFQDPAYGIEGLAHFVEHMIFMGSKRFPKENELDQFLSANGGASNAETDCEYTLFYFDIVEEHLQGALDRFSSLFVSPLMLREAMSREIEAVESEFQNNINLDANRIMQLVASKAEGVASTFTWGNLKTLKTDVDSDKVYESAHEFRKKFYVASNMCICIQSSESLEKLQDIVVNKFSSIQSGSRYLRNGDISNPFKEDFFEKVLYVKPKSDKLKLYVTFVMPSMEKHYKAKPHDYVAYIIQHEGIGSLSAYLKKHLLALHVEAGATDQSFEGNSMFTLFSINILLTEKGYEKIEEVLTAVFSILKMLKETSILQHKEAFEELKQIRDTSFEFREEKPSGEYTEELSVNMMFYESEDIIGGADKFYDFDGEMITRLIDIMNDGKFNLLLLTNKHDQYPFTEKWFGTSYDEIDIPESYKLLWKNCKFSPSQFFMPPPNEYICTKFDIVANAQKSTPVINPKLLASGDIELWFKTDSKFLLPHGFINCYMISPKIFKSTRNIILASLYSMTVKHYLSEKLYPAICAGLGYSISSAERGLLIRLSGYNEKLPILLDCIAKELKNIPNQIESSVFETYQKQFKKNGYNALINSKAFNKECRLTIVEEQHDFCYDRFLMIDDVKFEELVEFARDFPNELKIKILMMGNFNESEALEATKRLRENLQCKPILDEKSILPRCREIPLGTSTLYVKSLLTNDKNSTITNFYQIGKSTIRTQCLIEFAEKLMEEPLFDNLRTKEQLAYSVSCSHRVNNGYVGFSVTLQLQEEKNPTTKVDKRIEEFLRGDFVKILDNLSDEEFEANKISLIKLKKLDEVEMESENNRHWFEITSSEYIFDRLDKEAEMIGKLTKQEVLDFYKKIMLNTPKLSIQVIGNKDNEIDDQQQEDNKLMLLKILQINSKNDENIIKDIGAFRDSLKFFEPWSTVLE